MLCKHKPVNINLSNATSTINLKL